VPVLLPALGDEADITTLLARLDGIVLGGSRSMVGPIHYGGAKLPDHMPEDSARDATTLPLIRAAIARGLPVLAICRGVQELNVALGGTLHQQVHDIEGRLDHRSGTGTLDHEFRMRHKIRLSGQLARIVGETEIMVNSLHEQAIDRVADGLAVEAVAEDGTIEGVRVVGSKTFACGVQYHPEWHFRTDAPSRALFEAFGAAVRSHASCLKRAA
jgi:putative glutamine amidotransferase